MISSAFGFTIKSIRKVLQNISKIKTFRALDWTHFNIAKFREGLRTLKNFN